jgi:hypothetical protein
MAQQVYLVRNGAQPIWIARENDRTDVYDGETGELVLDAGARPFSEVVQQYKDGGWIETQAPDGAVPGKPWPPD